MAYWKPMKYEIEPVINTFGNGVNSYLTPFTIEDGELTDGLNMSCDSYPAIQTRADRARYTTVFENAANGIGRYKKALALLADGVTWRCWTGAFLTTMSNLVSSTEAAFDELVTGTARYAIMMNSSQRMYWDGGVATTALTISDTNLPYTKIFTVHKGRVYAVSNNSLHFSALNDLTDWTTIDDAGSITLSNMYGFASAICAYNDSVIIFSDGSMQELRGSGPANYELIEISKDIGCVNFKSVCEAQGLLFWVDYSGVYVFDGSVPVLISQKVQKWIDGINDFSLCCMGYKDDKIYIGIPYKSTANNMVLVYNITKGIWDAPQDGNFNRLVNINGLLYGTHSTTGVIWNMESTARTGNDNSTAIPWSFETKAYNDNEIEGKKTLRDMYIVHDGSSTATMAIDYTTNALSTTYSTLVPSTDITLDSEAEVHRTVIPTEKISNADWYKMKFSGTGKVRIHSLKKNVRVKK